MKSLFEKIKMPKLPEIRYGMATGEPYIPIGWNGNKLIYKTPNVGIIERALHIYMATYREKSNK